MAPPRSAVAQKLREQDPTLLPSEDESDDSDFALSDSELARNGDAGSSSSSSSSSSSGSDDEQGRDKAKKPATKKKKKNKATKRKRAAEEPVAPPAPPAAPVVDVDDLWAQFNAQDDDPYAPKPSTSTSAMTPTTTTTTNGNGNANGKGKAKADNQDEHDLVTIQIEYEFAGEKVQQQKKVKRSSAEAQAYFARNPTAGARKAAPLPPPKEDPTSASLDALFGPDESTLNPALASSTIEAAPVPPAPPAAAAGPAPKRRKVGGGGGLAGVAASLGVGPGGKPAKLNTLEKSKLDWTSYVSSETGLEDTLAHARKDGYLDRRDFLDRVDQSKEEQWDKARQAGRRR